MHFCSICQNMFYIQINAEDANKLEYYCRHCGKKDETISAENVCVSNSQFKKSAVSYEHMINKFTKLDPTLPRVNKVLCPNSECETNTEGKEREIIYIRYDDVNMKYVYLCSCCDTAWNIN